MADLISCSLSARRAATTRWRRMETKSKALKYVVCSRLMFLNRKISIKFLHLVFHYHHWNDCTEGLHSYIQTFEEDVLLLHIGWRPAMAEFSTWLIVSGWEPLSYLDWMYGWTVVCISYKSSLPNFFTLKKDSNYNAYIHSQSHSVLPLHSTVDVDLTGIPLEMGVQQILIYWCDF